MKIHKFQIHKPELTGDKVISSVHSRFLIEKGWKGSRKKHPSGLSHWLFCRKKSIRKKVRVQLFLYSGTRQYTSRMAAALKGVSDAGLKIPADEKNLSCR